MPISATATCPFCGSGRIHFAETYPQYDCGTKVINEIGSLVQSDKCKMSQGRVIAQNQRKMDEARTACVDAIPKLWYGLYQGCMREGFTSEQAMRLVIAFITKPVGKEE
jgi:hypothetical protein